MWALSKQELRDALVHVWSQEQKLAAQRLALIREIDAQGVARADGATSTTAWLNEVLRVNPGQARIMQTTAAALDDPCTVTGAVLARGGLNEAQAVVIGRCVTGLAEYGRTRQLQAEEFLIEQAAKHDPHTLKVLGERILERIDPDAADEHLRKRLEAEEKIAARDRFFTLTPDDHGRTRLTGLLGAEAAAIVAAAMEPLCRPADPTDRRSAAQRRADALRDVCALALATDALPDNRGEKTTVIVKLRVDPLDQQVREGLLDTGVSLSPEAVRRMACDAGIIPAVLNGQGLPLDVGREKRLFQGALRRALELRDGGCAFPGVRHEALSTFAEVRDLCHRDIALLW